MKYSISDVDQTSRRLFYGMFKTSVDQIELNSTL